MYRRLLTLQEKTESEGASLTVFRSFDPFGEPFQETIEKRAVIFPTNYFLSDRLFGAVMAAAQHAGDSSAYITQVEGWKQDVSFADFDRHGAIEFPGDDYVDAEADFDPLVLETAFYSATELWGVITSHMGHAVVGGMAEFMNYLVEHVDLDSSLRDFLAYWSDWSRKTGRAYKWVLPLLDHLYGRERVLQVANLSEPPFQMP